MTSGIVRSVATAALAAALTFAVAGCATGSSPAAKPQAAESAEASESISPADTEQGKALDAYVAAERASIPAVLEANPGVYSDAQIEGVYPDTVVYTFTYAGNMDATATAANLDDYVPTFQQSLDTSVFPAMESAGLKGTMHATYVYLNSDGSTIWQKDFTPST